MTKRKKRTKPRPEECWIIAGETGMTRHGRYFANAHSIAHITGSTGEVEFPWRIAMNQEETGDNEDEVLGFMHTHPHAKAPAMSQRDKLTMKAWVQAFGKPLICGIGVPRRKHWHFGYWLVKKNGTYRLRADTVFGKTLCLPITVI